MSLTIEQYEEFLNRLSPQERELNLKLNRSTLCKGGRVRRLPKRVFHISPIKNRESITQRGLKSNIEGAIFVCPSIEDCMQFVIEQNYAIAKTQEYDIWEVATQKTHYHKWYVNDAYRQDIINARSFVYLDNNILPFMLKRKGVLHID